MPQHQDFPAKGKSMNATSGRTSAVAGIAAGGHTSDGKGTNNEGTLATTKTLATAVPPTKAGKAGMQN
jgi:hypothetical protein